MWTTLENQSAERVNLRDGVVTAITPRHSVPLPWLHSELIRVRDHVLLPVTWVAVLNTSNKTYYYNSVHVFARQKDTVLRAHANGAPVC